MTRDEAIKWLQGIEERYFHGGDEAYDKRRREAVRIAIEALERKRGKWIIREPKDLHSTCSCCGFYNAINPYYKYCPNCGSDMRKILPKH